MARRLPAALIMLPYPDRGIKTYNGNTCCNHNKNCKKD